MLIQKAKSFKRKIFHTRLKKLIFCPKKKFLILVWKTNLLCLCLKAIFETKVIWVYSYCLIITALFILSYCLIHTVVSIAFYDDPFFCILTGSNLCQPKKISRGVTMDEVFEYFVESSCAQETLEKGVKITIK